MNRQEQHRAELTSAEIAALWNSCMTESMSIRILSYFLNNIKDPEIHAAVRQAYDSSSRNTAGWKSRRKRRTGAR
ncbi:DUF3231 family protein [Paenibacillus chartarius]|uniref:DUF3231 family protein n=1 Tax=Paenibacillus chartarius TaxID=747481 RepID=A0ABV6DFE5_9BACL